MNIYIYHFLLYPYNILYLFVLYKLSMYLFHPSVFVKAHSDVCVIFASPTTKHVRNLSTPAYTCMCINMPKYSLLNSCLSNMVLLPWVMQMNQKLCKAK